MIKSILFAAASVASLSVSTVASAAALYVIDDFTTEPANPFFSYLDAQGQSETQGPVGYAIAGHYFERTAFFQNVEDADEDIGTELYIGDGSLDITNWGDLRSRLTLTYNVNSLYGLIAPNSAVELGVTFSNGLNSYNGPTTIQAFLNGSSLGSIVLSQRIDATPVMFNTIQLLGSQLLPNSELSFVINGPSGYDLSIDEIAVNQAPLAQVPEPAILGLFGLSLVGLGIARRRKR